MSPLCLDRSPARSPDLWHPKYRGRGRIASIRSATQQIRHGGPTAAGGTCTPALAYLQVRFTSRLVGWLVVGLLSTILFIYLVPPYVVKLTKPLPPHTCQLPHSPNLWRLFLSYAQDTNRKPPSLGLRYPLGAQQSEKLLFCSAAAGLRGPPGVPTVFPDFLGLGSGAGSGGEVDSPLFLTEGRFLCILKDFGLVPSLVGKVSELCCAVLCCAV